MASKFVWLAGKRGYIVAIAALLAAVLGCGAPDDCRGFWDEL